MQNVGTVFIHGILSRIFREMKIFVPGSEIIFLFSTTRLLTFCTGKTLEWKASVESSVVNPDPDPHQIERYDPDPHQIDKLDLDPPKFADEKPKCMEHVLPYLSTFIWKLGSGSGSAPKWKVGSGPASASKWQAGSGSASESESKWCSSATLHWRENNLVIWRNKTRFINPKGIQKPTACLLKIQHF